METFNSDSNNKGKSKNVPKFIINNKTYWYRWLILSLLNAILLLILIPFLNIEDFRDETKLFFILYSFLLAFPLIIGFFWKNTIRTFLITTINPKIYQKEENLLTYSIQMRKVKISKKYFHLNDVKRFEVIQRKKKDSLKWYCALVLKSGKYFTITTLLDEPLAFHYTKELNKFLDTNTTIEKKILEKPLIPYIPRKEQKKIKFFSIIKISLILFIIFLLLLIFVIFWIANIEILPAFIILITLICMGCLLVMALNGATFDSL